LIAAAIFAGPDRIHFFPRNPIRARAVHAFFP
jgi:hypothetical protein